MNRTRKLLFGFSMVFTLAATTWAQSGDAYRVFGNSIRTDRASHWRNWVYQNDLVNSLSVPLEQADILSVDDEGIRPTFYRKNLNVAPTASEFEYSDLVRAGGNIVSGGAKALSNSSEAFRAIDGDLSTYWEPTTPANFETRLSGSHPSWVSPKMSEQLSLTVVQHSSSGVSLS